MHHQILKAFHLYTTQGTSSNIKSWCFLILVSEGNDFFIILVLLCVTIVVVCSFKWYFVHIFDDNFTDNYWIASDWLAATLLNSYNKWLIWTVWFKISYQNLSMDPKSVISFVANKRNMRDIYDTCHPVRMSSVSLKRGLGSIW